MTRFLGILVAIISSGLFAVSMAIAMIWTYGVFGGLLNGGSIFVGIILILLSAIAAYMTAKGAVSVVAEEFREVWNWRRRNGRKS